MNTIVEEATAVMASTVTASSTPLPTHLLTTSADSHELTLNATKITTANKLHQTNEFANSLDNQMRRFDKRLITDGDTFVLNYRGEVNKKVI